MSGGGRDRRTLSLMAAGHLCADLAQGSVPALVPFLVRGPDGIGYGRAGVLVLVMALTSSVVQPLIGTWADRRRARWPVPAGVAVAGLGIAALGLVAGSYPAMLLAVAAAGLGVALFHPDGARRATVAAGARPAGGLGLFAVGGSAGFALAPAILTPAVLAWGLPGTVVVLALALPVAAVLARTLEPVAAGTGDRREVAAGAPPDRPRAFTLVVGVASLRAGSYFGAQTLLAVAVAARLDLSPGAANAVLTVMLAAGAAGTLLGGLVADRLGNRRTIAVAQATVVPALVLVQVAPSPGLAAVAAALLGVAMTGAYSPTIVLGQQLMPRSQRLAAGMTVGFAIGAGGVAASGLGAVADVTGPSAALWAVAGFGAAGALLALRLDRG